MNYKLKDSLGIIVLLIILSSCTNNKSTLEVDNLNKLLSEKNSEIDILTSKLTEKESDINNNLTQQQKIIDEYKAKLEQKDKEYNELNEIARNFRKDAENFIGQVEQLEYKLEEKRKQDNMVSLNGIRLGYTREQVEEILGENYIEGSYVIWEETSIKLEYEGMIIKFDCDEKVRSIRLKSQLYNTDFNVKVGDTAIESLEICKGFFKEFTSIHLDEPNLGWFETNNKEMIRLIFNDKEDWFNYDVTLEDSYVVEILLDWTSNFD